MMNVPLRPSAEKPTLHRVDREVEDHVNDRCFPQGPMRGVYLVEGAPCPPFNQVIVGPCVTLAGELLPDQCAISRATADAVWEVLTQPHVNLQPHFTIGNPTGGLFPVAPVTEPQEQPMAVDIEHKTFAVKREEWFVPTGDYTDQYGACWTDLRLAITHATNRLKELGKFDGVGEPASDLIKVVPHDAHVVVRIEYTEDGA